jgi:integrase
MSWARATCWSSLNGTGWNCRITSIALLREVTSISPTRRAVAQRSPAHVSSFPTPPIRHSGQHTEKTKVEWSRYLGRIEKAWGPLAVINLEPKHVVALRDKFADTPAAANNLLRCLSAMVSWSVLRGSRSDNPCLIVPKLNRSVPYAPWPWSVIEIVRDRAPPELWWVAAVALYSGQRQGDVLRMKWSDIRDGHMSVVQEKTGTHVEVPIHRDLAVVLASIPKRSIFILTSSKAAPWTGDGFRTSWGRMAERLKLDAGLVFHGLRKSAVVMLLEAGCTDSRGRRDHRPVAKDGRASRSASE